MSQSKKEMNNLSTLLEDSLDLENQYEDNWENGWVNHNNKINENECIEDWEEGWNIVEDEEWEVEWISKQKDDDTKENWEKGWINQQDENYSSDE